MSADPVDTTGVGRRMAKGAAWTVGMRLAIRLLGLISTIVLARLLVPADFGLLAIATMIIAGLEVMSEFSFNIFLITNQASDSDDYDTAWTLSVIRGLVMAVVLVALAAPAAGFFDDPRLEGIFYWLALGTAVSGFQNIGIVDFQKHLVMHRDFILEVVCKACAIAMAIGFALWWRNYWALVAGMLTAQAIRVALSYVMHPYRPRFRLTRWRAIWGFSKWLIINNIAMFFSNRSDTFVLGKLLNAQAVGIYAIAYEISNLATSELIVPIRRALLPGFSQIAEDSARLKHVFLESLTLIVMIGTPVAAGIGLVADPLVRLFLGEKWLQAIPLIEILAVYGLFQILSSNLYSVILAMRRPALIAILSGGTVACMLPILIWGAWQYGAYGAALAVTGVTALSVIAYFVVVVRLLQVIWRHILDRVWRTVVAASIMSVAVVAAKAAMPVAATASALGGELAACVAAGAAAYVVCHFVLWILAGRPNGAEMHILDLIGTNTRLAMFSSKLKFMKCKKRSHYL